MDARDLIDSTRLAFQSDASTAPTRSITYKRLSDRVSSVLNSFVGVGLFNKIERETIGRFQSFGGLPLTVPPEVDDVIVYDSEVWKVVRWTKLGQLYTVFCENKSHNGKPK